MNSERRFLFVDDDPLLTKAFVAQARRLGFSVDVASNGTEALSCAASTPYPVVMADLHLPGIDGVTLIRKLSALHPSTAFVLVTGSPHLDQAQLDNPSGALASLLTKPWQPEQLENALELAFALHEKRMQDTPRVAHADLSSQPPPPSVMIVDYSPSDALLLEHYVSEISGSQTLRVNCLSEALSAIRERSVDVIVTDLSLPDAQGLDAVMQLRAAAPEAAIVACSSIDDEALSLQILQLGAQEVLIKSAMDASSVRRAVRFATQRRRSERALGRLAHSDALTGLANRTSLNERLAVELSRARRHGSQLAVLALDLDGFKPVNDLYGHHAGDRLLQEIALRMQRAFREYDSVARIGGDEFVVLLPDVSETAQLEIIAARLLHKLAVPVDVGARRVQVTASVGIAIFSAGADGGTELLQRADDALYEAKRAGKNCYRFAKPNAESGSFLSGSRVTARASSFPTVRPGLSA